MQCQPSKESPSDKDQMPFFQEADPVFIASKYMSCMTANVKSTCFAGYHLEVDKMTRNWKTEETGESSDRKTLDHAVTQIV
ncbi:hypothetical protein SADUNF_Sadunf15G0112000 [Salix dunnii]|uniref:Uncharacterized protein n=1 Tax=Salix dunnii TaxID=1413687 RepID=A0A835JJI1_9ROSI|nr:hypothetical protein SADUNF_Sadunf15G0112000 [Salix dunnii]